VAAGLPDEVKNAAPRRASHRNYLIAAAPTGVAAIFS
jgi:hypothetical protein